MTLNELIFYFFISTTIGSVLLILFSRTVFYSVLALITCLLSLAGIYGLLSAEYLAITQVVIYAGGVIILILFAIMLTNRIAGTPLLTESQNKITGILISAALLFTLITSYQNSTLPDSFTEIPTANHIHQIGVELMSTYVAPFEVSGVLLLVCLIGASLMASTFKKSKP